MPCFLKPPNVQLADVFTEYASAMTCAMTGLFAYKCFDYTKYKVYYVYNVTDNCYHIFKRVDTLVDKYIISCILFQTCINTVKLLVIYFKGWRYKRKFYSLVLRIEFRRYILKYFIVFCTSNWGKHAD